MLVMLAIALSSCVTNKRLRFMQEPGHGIPAYEKMVTPEDYRVQVMDELSINIITMDPQMNELFNLASSGAEGGTYSINDDGNIIFPYVGPVYVLNKTTREIKTAIADMLSSFVKMDYSVTVELSNSYFSILGEAKNGRFALTKERMSVFQAIAQAGDLGDYADRAHIKLLRNTPNGPVIKEFDIRSKDIVDSEYYYIQPNDVIYVQLFNGQYFQINSFTAWFSFITTIVSLSYVILRFDHIF